MGMGVIQKEVKVSKLAAIVDDRGTDWEEEKHIENIITDEEKEVLSEEIYEEKIEIERLVTDVTIFKNVLKYYSDVYTWYKLMKFLSKNTMKLWDWKEPEYIWSISKRYPLMMDDFITKYININKVYPKILNYFTIPKLTLFNDFDAEEFIQFIKSRPNSYLHQDMLIKLIIFGCTSNFKVILYSC